MATIVRLIDEGVLGVVQHLGAYMSMVEYTYKGFEYQVWVENDEFEILEDD